MQSSVGGWQLSFSSNTKDTSSSRNRFIRVLFLGQPGVGKTAIAVRFATRRYIGEYDSSQERIYRIEGTLGSSWEIADPPGDTSLPPNESRLRWADAVLLIYSVTDRVSFDEVWRLRFLLNQSRKPSYARKPAPPVVLLIGNKTDLGAGPAHKDRMVSTAEGRARARHIEAHGFYEISARESVDQVMAVFASLARLAPLVLGPQHHSFRLRASTDGSIETRRRQQQQNRQPGYQDEIYGSDSSRPLRRRLSISARGAPH
ncbi:hypothetical protein QAD02_011761 [Eretmocerus hayati]|uniref:Uncharacterized protein n=1 Tax=Eretmocerus hayati TaxID=131215 RepID=A0ACC2P2I3_9HYME|nr:hypothetical protein QAD02_011761 [Eretmocerus hayati]